MNNLDFYGTVSLSLLAFVGLFGLITCQLYASNSGETFAYMFIGAIFLLMILKGIILIKSK